eukprot:2915392-Ditylum_brightwellii.AAC.1
MAPETISTQDYLLQKTNLIKSIEQTNNLEEKGKCSFIGKKPNAVAASNFLDNKLKNLYQRHCP